VVMMTMVLELLASKLGRNDERPNIELAERICKLADRNGIGEILLGMKSGDVAVANDCIKVLYEVGQREPTLISDYANDFISALASKNNRLVWGSMTALASISTVNPKAIFARLPEIYEAYANGSVITVDNSISVFAQICKANDEYNTKVFPILIEHILSCRAKEVPQHAERIEICINSDNKQVFIGALETRIAELSQSQSHRVKKVLKRLKAIDS